MASPRNDLYEGDTEGMAGLRPVEQILAIAGGVFGGAIALAALVLVELRRTTRAARAARRSP